MEPVIRAASLRGFERLVEDLGGDAGPLLDRFGIERAALANPDGLVSITAHDRMLDAAAVELRCPDLGLRLAERQDLDILGPLALAVSNSPTPGHALDCASRFMFVHSPALRVAIEPDPLGDRAVVALTYRKDLAMSPYCPQAMELGLGLFHHVAAALVGGLDGLHSVQLSHAPLSAQSRYAEFFGAEVRFDQPVAALRIDRGLLDERFASANELIRAMAIAHLMDGFVDPSSTVSLQTRAVLGEILSTTPVTIGHVAGLLSMHPRTLQRRLAAESTSFETVLDRARREAATRDLTTTDLPLGQVAARAGFTEQSSLSHACRRWYDASPRAVRNDPDLVRESPALRSPRNLSR